MRIADGLSAEYAIRAKLMDGKRDAPILALCSTGAPLEASATGWIQESAQLTVSGPRSALSALSNAHCQQSGFRTVRISQSAVLRSG
jgi:hypothetical protein